VFEKNEQMKQRLIIYHEYNKRMHKLVPEIFYNKKSENLDESRQEE